MPKVPDPLHFESVKDDQQTTFSRAREAAAVILGRLRRRRSALPRPGPPRARVFRDGDVIAGRYRVLRFLEHGGAGQVYEVEDSELGGRAALKTLHLRLASSREALDQFKREILLARTVTHEGVCRLFDFGRHPAEGDREDRLFVTMELLDGETLCERIRRRGPFDLSEALELGSQIAAGLAAAHRQGVIHRDVKGSNVLLVKRPDGSTRAVVSDFGLALGTPAEDPGAEVPSPSRLEGTPLFMAPEQVRGEAVSAATDVYALGVLLYQMLTGRWPFVGDTPVSTALLRIEQDPVSPTKYLPGLDPRCERLILRCLERDPARRFASAAELGATLDALREPAGQRERTVLRTAARWLAPLAVAVALGVTGGFWLSRDAGPPPAGRPSVVVLGFANDTARPELDWVGTVLAQGIASGLTAGERLRAIDGAAAGIGADLGLSEPASIGSRDYDRIGRRSGADYALTGAYRLTGAEPDAHQLDLTLRLQALRGGPSGTTLDVSGQLDGLAELTARVSQDLRAELRLPRLSDQQTRSGRAELPEHPEAARLYAEGLAALRRFDAQTASDRLDAALELEPAHPMILIRLAEAWSELGHGARARESAERAFGACERLSREKQLAIEARYRFLTHDWQRAEELYRALREFFPDDVDYGLSLAETQDRGARLDQASATLAALRELPEPWGDDPRIDLAEANVAYHSGDYPRSQAAAARAAATGRQLGARSLVAGALSREALTRVETDDDQEGVFERLLEARRLYAEVGNKRGLVTVLLTLGEQASRRGGLEEAEAYYHPALDIAAEIGDATGLARGKTALAILLDQRGRLSEGLALKEEVLDSYRRRDVEQGAAIMLENLGISLLKMGRLEEALARLVEAAGRFEQLGDQIGLAWSPYYQGRVWFAYGELELAKNRLRDAGEAAIEHPAGGLASYVAFELARIELAAGDLAAAEERARALAGELERLGQPGDAAEARLLLARVASAGGEPGRAVELAEAALAVFEEQGTVVLAAAALTELARAQPAKTTCEPLALRLADLEHASVALRGRVALARCALEVDGASPAVVTSELEAVTVAAQALGLFEPRLEAGRLRAEVSAVGERERDTRLATLRQEAEKLGWWWRPTRNGRAVIANTGVPR